MPEFGSRMFSEIIECNRRDQAHPATRVLSQSVPKPIVLRPNCARWSRSLENDFHESLPLFRRTSTIPNWQRSICIKANPDTFRLESPAQSQDTRKRGVSRRLGNCPGRRSPAESPGWKRGGRWEKPVNSRRSVASRGEEVHGKGGSRPSAMGYLWTKLNFLWLFDEQMKGTFWKYFVGINLAEG